MLTFILNTYKCQAIVYLILSVVAQVAPDQKITHMWVKYFFMHHCDWLGVSGACKAFKCSVSLGFA